MSQPFDSVRDQLLRAGIAPRHVRRYVVELREHLADLTARELRTGIEAPAAGEHARALLGTDAQLAQAMIERTPRSLTTRAPWAVLALLPIVVLVAILTAIDASMAHVLGPAHESWHGGAPTTYGGIIAAASFIADYLLGPALAAGCLAVALRQRLASRWMWIGLGLIALLSGMFGFYMTVVPSVGRFPGGAVFSGMPVVWVDGRPNGAATLGLVALRAGALFTVAGLGYGALRSRLRV